MSTIGDKLREVRKAKGVTKEQLAEAIGAHYMQLSKYERGINMPGAEILSKIALSLGVPLNSLVDDDMQILRDIAEGDTCRHVDIYNMVSGGSGAGSCNTLKVPG